MARKSVDTAWYEAECLAAVRRCLESPGVRKDWAFFGMTLVDVERRGTRPDTTIDVTVRYYRGGRERTFPCSVWDGAPLGPHGDGWFPDAEFFAANVHDSIMES